MTITTTAIDSSQTLITDIEPQEPPISNRDNPKSWLLSHIPTAKLLSSTGSELNFRLPVTYQI